MKINLVEMSSFNAWIDRMEETGFLEFTQIIV